MAQTLSSEQKSKTLLIRMDKIGDLVLTMALDQAVPGESVWFITKGLDFLPMSSEPPRKFKAFQRKFFGPEYRRMLKEIRKIHPERAIVFHAPWWVALALWRAKVPVRVGVKSKWHSFLFFNKALRQKRSRSVQHEAQYGLDLIQYAFDQNALQLSEIKPLDLKASLSLSALSQKGLEPKTYVVVHPGMGGSALNWPAGHYIDLIKRVSQDIRVVITGGPSDEAFVASIKSYFLREDQGFEEDSVSDEDGNSLPLNQRGDEESREDMSGQESQEEALVKKSQIDTQNPALKRKVLFFDGSLTISELLLVLENSKGVLAPSTGVLHLGASLGIPSLGIYSPVLQERATRWGPRGKKVETLTPLVNGHSFDKKTIMSSLSVEKVYDRFMSLIGLRNMDVENPHEKKEIVQNAEVPYSKG